MEASCLSVLRTAKLPEGVQWPLCMQMFMPIEELKPIVEASGLTDVVIDASDSLMAFEVRHWVSTCEPLACCAQSPVDRERRPAQIDDDSPEASESANNTRRNRVHVGSKEFEHLKNFDMNELCARVVVTGRKARARSDDL